MTTITYANGTIDREAALRSYEHTVTAPQATADVAVIDLGLGSTATIVPLSVQLGVAGNVRRAPAGAVLGINGTVSVTDTTMLAGEKIFILAAAYAA
jgi:hypothetical protein